MTNSYYNPTGAPVTEGRGLSAVIRAEFAAIGAGFDLVEDFDEGTFTPAFFGYPTDFTSVAYDDQNGAYIKIGKLVMFRIRIATTSAVIGPAGGALAVSGLPYVCSSTGNYADFHGAVALAAGFVTNNPSGYRIQAGTDSLVLSYRATANGETQALTTAAMNSASAMELEFSGFYFTD